MMKWTLLLVIMFGEWLLAAYVLWDGLANGWLRGV